MINFLATISGLIIGSAVLFVVIAVLREEPIDYCKKHQKLRQPHDWDETLRCDDCWTEDIKTVMKMIRQQVPKDVI